MFGAEVQDVSPGGAIGGATARPGLGAATPPIFPVSRFHACLEIRYNSDETVADGPSALRIK